MHCNKATSQITAINNITVYAFFHSNIDTTSVDAFTTC